jgi:hypothetical protein
MKLKLTSATMDQFQQGVEVSKLTRVFREAIRITQYLGMEYLWIDALCIKQDENDLADWNIESRNMNSVYSHAFLNISSPLSSTGNESLFRFRATRPNLPAAIMLEINGSLEKFFVVDGNLWQEEVDESPLNKRAWVYQERFSAGRVIHFGQRQLAWECREIAGLEMFPGGLHRAIAIGGISKPSTYNQLIAIAESSSATVADGTVDDKFATGWHALVQNYCECRLTFSKDKLIAFEGISQAYTERSRGHCVAGVWKHNLELDLMWSRGLMEEDSFPISETSYRAPSWSWACVDGTIHFPVPLGSLVRSFIGAREIIEPNSNDKKTISRHPTIRVLGSCLPVKIKWSQGEISQFQIATFCFTPDDAFGAKLYFDGPETKILPSIKKNAYSRYL